MNEKVQDKKPLQGMKFSSKSLIQKMAKQSRILNMEQIKEESFEHSN